MQITKQIKEEEKRETSDDEEVDKTGNSDPTQEREKLPNAQTLLRMKCQHRLT